MSAVARPRHGWVAWLSFPLVLLFFQAKTWSIIEVCVIFGCVHHWKRDEMSIWSCYETKEALVHWRGRSVRVRQVEHHRCKENPMQIAERACCLVKAVSHVIKDKWSNFSTLTYRTIWLYKITLYNECIMFQWHSYTTVWKCSIIVELWD